MESFLALWQEAGVNGAVAVAVGFVAGSVPFGLILALIFGRTDVRTAGSGNIGATNVARVVGKKLGMLTLVLDALKGALPIVGASEVVLVSTPALSALLGGLVGLAALLGHCFTPWLRFRGGKGVATGLGMLVALHPEVAAYGLVAFAIAFLGSRVVSLSSLTAAVVVVVALFWRGPVDVTLAPMLLALLVIVARHKENIDRLRQRRELTL